MEPLAIVLDGFSKTYAMTGWRLGYGVMPAPMAQVVAKLQTNATSCTATFSQMAGGGRPARSDQSLGRRSMVAEFRRRRDAIVDGLRAIPGFAVRAAQGRLLRASPTSPARASRAARWPTVLLDEAGVACLSGTAFGEFGEGHLRFSYANSMENIRGGAAPHPATAGALA